MSLDIAHILALTKEANALLRAYTYTGEQRYRMTNCHAIVFLTLRRTMAVVISNRQNSISHF